MVSWLNILYGDFQSMKSSFNAYAMWIWCPNCRCCFFILVFLQQIIKKKCMDLNSYGTLETLSAVVASYFIVCSMDILSINYILLHIIAGSAAKYIEASNAYGQTCTEWFHFIALRQTHTHMLTHTLTASKKEKKSTHQLLILQKLKAI